MRLYVYLHRRGCACCHNYIVSPPLDFCSSNELWRPPCWHVFNFVLCSQVPQLLYNQAADSGHSQRHCLHFQKHPRALSCLELCQKQLGLHPWAVSIHAWLCNSTIVSTWAGGYFNIIYFSFLISLLHAATVLDILFLNIQVRKC